MERNVVTIIILLQVDGESLSEISWCNLHSKLLALGKYLIVHVYRLSWEFYARLSWSWSLSR